MTFALRHARGSWLAIAGSFLLASTAAASGPSVWTLEGYDLAAGEARGVSVRADGTTTLAPPLRQQIDTPEPRIWSLAATAAGAFYGAGEDGRVRWRGDGASEDVVVLERPGLTAQAMAMGAEGTLYVAMGPGGAVYRIAAGAVDGNAEPWVQLSQRYVWAMVEDAEGRLIVATGDDGRILRLGPDGSTEVLYDTPEAHVTALALAPDGTIFAGTEGSAYVYRIAPDGDVMVLLDAPQREITGMLLSGSSLWVSAAGGDSGASVEGATGEAAVRVATGAGGNGAAGGGGGAVYRIDADGLVDSMWSSTELAPYALAAIEAGIVVGTGPRARLLLLGEAPGRWGLLADLEDGQVVALSGGTRLVAAVANPGRVLSFGQGHRESGTLDSLPRDTGTTSRWGVLRWSADTPAGTTLLLQTRSGNSGEPDDTWSNWSAPLGNPDGSRIDSPPARYLQWRAVLRSTAATVSPALRRVEAVYVARNRRPRVETLTVHPAGVVYRDNSGFDDGMPFAQVPPSVARQLRDSGADGGAVSTGGRSFLGRAYFVAGLRTISWEASDADQDVLAFDLYVRPEAGGTAWMPVAEGLTASSYVLDTGKLPDGHYEVRLVARDGPGRVSSEALAGERIGGGLVVDNTAPESDGFVAVRDGQRVVVRGNVADRTSVIAALQYSLDGGAWITVGAADGAADSAAEAVEFTLPVPDAGEHLVIVRVADSALNEASIRVPVPAEPR